MQQPVWGLHSRPGDTVVYDVFLKQGYVGIAWSRFGDLSAIKPEQKAFRAMLAKHWPNNTAASIRIMAAQLYALVHRMNEDNAVIYPSPIRDHKVHIGIVTGPYRHDPQISYDCPDLRKVKWKLEINRNDLPADILSSLGSQLTLYQIHRNPEYVWQKIAEQ